jgi:hypothetical protein
LKIRSKFGWSKVHSYLLIQVFVIFFENSCFLKTCITYWVPIITSKIKWYWKCIWIFIQIQDYNPSFHFKRPNLLYVQCIFSKFHHYVHILIHDGKFMTIVIHKKNYHIANFNIYLWHLKKLHFVKSLMWWKN